MNIQSEEANKKPHKKSKNTQSIMKLRTKEKYSRYDIKY